MKEASQESASHSITGAVIQSGAIVKPKCTFTESNSIKEQRRSVNNAGALSSDATSICEQLPSASAIVCPASSVPLPQRDKERTGTSFQTVGFGPSSSSLVLVQQSVQ